MARAVSETTRWASCGDQEGAYVGQVRCNYYGENQQITIGSQCESVMTVRMNRFLFPILLRDQGTVWSVVV